MEIKKTIKFPLFRWIAAPIVTILSLTLMLIGGVGAKTINEELHKGNNIMAFAMSVLAGFLVVILPIFLGISIAPNHRRIFGVVVGILVILTLLSLYIYIGITMDFTLPIIGRLLGVVVGTISSIFLISKGTHDELNIWSKDKT